MHTKKFVKRLTELATSEKDVEKIVDEIAKGLVANRITQKDLDAIAKQLHADTTTKATMKASKENILPEGANYDFQKSDTLGLQVEEGDRMYKRTFDGDVNKVLQ